MLYVLRETVLYLARRMTHLTWIIIISINNIGIFVVGNSKVIVVVILFHSLSPSCLLLLQTNPDNDTKQSHHQDSQHCYDKYNNHFRCWL